MNKTVGLFVFCVATIATALLFPDMSVEAQTTMRGIRRNMSNMSSGTAGECSTSHVRMCDGCKINVTMRVVTGQTCHLSLASPRPLLSHELIQRPQHGRYGSASVSDAAYIAPQGYTGPDSFVLSIYRVALDNQKARETRMNVRVEVVP